MNKLIAPLALTASLFTVPALAGQVILGATGFDGTMNVNFTQTFPTISGVEIDTNAENSQLGGGLYGGYVWNVNSGFNINFEAFYDFMYLTVSQTTLTFDGEIFKPITYKVNGLGGLRVLPAFKVTNNTSLFLELGWAYFDQTFTDPNTPSTTISEWTSGFRYGAGVQTMLYQNISLRVFYSVVDELAQVKLSHPSDGNLTGQPNFTEFGVGIAYHFQV